MNRVKFPWLGVAPMPLPCKECDDAPCMNASKDDAVINRDDGIMVVGRRMLA